RVGGADLVGRYRQPALRQGELDRHRDRRCHAHAFFLVGRPHSRYSEAERIADPADHVARLVPDTVHGLADGLAGVVGGLARAGGRVDDTARVDGHVEPDFAAHPEGRTRRRADVELAVVTHAELRIGGGTDTGPRLTVHTGTDTGDLAADITTGLGTGERLGTDVGPGEPDTRVGGGLGARHRLAAGRHARVIAQVHLARGVGLGTHERLGTGLRPERVDARLRTGLGTVETAGVAAARHTHAGVELTGHLALGQVRLGVGPCREAVLGDLGVGARLGTEE